MAAQESLHLVVEERERQEDSLEHGVNLDEGVDNAYGFLRYVAYDCRDCKEYHERIADPHEVDAHGMENEPVRLGDERESVGVVAEEQQQAQQDVSAPCGKRYQDK